MLIHITTFVPMPCPFSRRPPFPTSTCLNISHTHTPAQPFTACSNSLKPSLYKQAVSDLPTLSFLNACRVYCIIEDIITLSSNAQAASPNTLQEPEGTRPCCLYRAQQSAEHLPLGRLPTRQHAQPFTLVLLMQRRSILKSFQRTEFGVSWLKADRMTAYLSTLA